MKIVADDKIPFLKGVFEPFAEVVYHPGSEITNAMLRDANALLVRSITPCNENLLKGSTVRLIASATIGDDHIDKEYCHRAGVRWTTAKGCNAEAVNQYILATLLTLAQRKGMTLKGKSLGIIGVGSIGTKVYKTADCLGMNTLLNDPPREMLENATVFVHLDELMQEADIISLHVPLTMKGQHKTHHLIGRDLLNRLDKPIMLINTSRGSVLETNAVKDSVKAGMIEGLVLDVYENEPFPDLELIQMADIATPHVAGYSMEGKIMGSTMTVRAVSNYFNLGINDWKPIVNRDVKGLTVKCTASGDQKVIYDLMKKIYDVEHDSDALKQSPDRFEMLRREYRFRDENSNYRLQADNCDQKVIDCLVGLGFQIQNQ